MRILRQAQRYDNKRKINVIVSIYLLLFTFFITLSGCIHNNSSKHAIGVISISFPSEQSDNLPLPIEFDCTLQELLGDYYYLKNKFQHYQFFLEKESSSGNERIIAQWIPDPTFSWETPTDQGKLIWILDGKSAKETEYNYNLYIEKIDSVESPFTFEDINNRSILAKNSDKPILQYNYGIIPKKEGKTGAFDRSSYIHPVWTPSGKIITGDFSPEHEYQRGIFKAWRKVIFEDVTTEFWSVGLKLFDQPAKTLIDDRKFEILNGPTVSQITIYNKGLVGDVKTYSKETDVVRIYNLGQQDIWMFDLIFKETPVDPENPDDFPQNLKSMELAQYHYGGLSFRGASPDWLRPDRISSEDEVYKNHGICLADKDSLDVITNLGFNRFTGNGTSAKWIDYTGPLGKEWGGLAVFDHPSNPRYPAPLRIHPYLPYFSYAFTKDAPHTITSEQPLSLKYRFIVHNGHPDKKMNEQVVRHLETPPQIIWNRIE